MEAKAHQRRFAALGFSALCGALFCPDAAAAEYAPAVPPPAVDPTEVIARKEWLRWWIFDVKPHVSAEAVYDDNVNISSATKQDDFIWVASPGLTAIAGDPMAEGARLLNISYTPSFVVFTEHSQYDSIDHSASINGIWPFSKLTLGFRQTYDRSTGGIVDVGNRVERETYGTALTSAYELSEKTSFEINAHQQIADYPAPLIGTKEWSNDDWINYLISAKVTLGLGFTFGHVEVDRNPSQDYERALLRASYKLTYKVDLTASVGGELREYDQGSQHLGAIFSMGGTYWPTESTSFSIEGHRDNRNSALLAGQNYISTGIGLTARQRLIERLFLNLGGSYEHAEYESAVSGVAATRSQDYFVLNSGLDVSLTERWLAGLFFRHRENLSNEGSFGFTNNQIGMQTSYQF